MVHLYDFSSNWLTIVLRLSGPKVGARVQSCKKCSSYSYSYRSIGKEKRIHPDMLSVALNPSFHIRAFSTATDANTSIEVDTDFLLQPDPESRMLIYSTLDL